MSLIQRLKMTCDISRSTKTIDDYGNVTLTWNVIGSSVKCYIHQFEQSYGKYSIGVTGVELENRYVAYFKPGADIISGDKLTSSYFIDLEFYIISVTPIVRPQTGKIHHLEVIMQLNPT